MNAQTFIPDQCVSLGVTTVDQALFSGVRAKAQQWPAIGCTVATLAATNGHTGRCARLHISFGPLVQGVSLWGAHFQEVDALPEAEPVEWLLVSEQPVTCVEDALRLLCARHDLVTRLDCR